MIKYLVFPIIAAFLSSAVASDSLVSISQMQAQCAFMRERARALEFVSLSKGGIKYIPISQIQAGQGRFSFARFRENILNPSRGETLSYLGGLSAYGPSYAKIKGVAYRGRIHLLDGHHHALAGIYAGSLMLPVRIVDDVSHLPESNLAEHLFSLGYSYPFSPTGELMTLDLCFLVEDPYLSLAQNLMHRVKIEKRNGQLKINSVKGPKFAVLIKINDDISFLELEIADALYRSGIKISDPAATPTRMELEQILRALKKSSNTSRLQHALLLDMPLRYTKANYVSIIERHLKRPNPCAYFLSDT